VDVLVTGAGVNAGVLVFANVGVGSLPQPAKSVVAANSNPTIRAVRRMCRITVSPGYGSHHPFVMAM
jgi:hypothetical protein